MKETSEIFQLGDTIKWEKVDDKLERKILGYDDKIMLVKVHFKEGGIGYKHSHFHSQTTYVESGKFEVTVGNETKVLKAGDGFYVPPNVEHGAVNLEDGILIDVFSPVREDFLEK
ncbi:MAG: cupin domain-containing protein [Melioribacteraceae bacterium]|nr:cupin domain-containing protein [Melioribacteraceae bacterium]